MSERRVATKEELLANIDEYWTRLCNAIERLAEGQLTTPRDAQGWTVTDHLVHLAAWERSVVFFLQGKARHAGLGVDEAVYLTGDEDKINEAIHQSRKDVPPAEALRQLHATHQELLRLVAALSDEDLHKSYRHYLPEEPGDGDGPPAINLIYGNSAHHFKEHLEWIEVLVDDEGV